MINFEDLIYFWTPETAFVKKPRPLVPDYEDFLINYFENFFPLDIDSVLEANAIRFNQLGLNRLVPYNEFKKFHETLEFFTPENKKTQFKLFFGGVIFNQNFQKNLPKYQNFLKKIDDHFKENKVKDILDIYSLKEAKSLASFLLAKIGSMASFKSETFTSSLPELFNQFNAPITEIRGNLSRQKQTLKGFRLFLKDDLKYREKFFYNEVEKRDTPRKLTLQILATMLSIGIAGYYLSEFFISYDKEVEPTWLNIAFSISSTCSLIFCGLAIIGLAMISENIFKVNKQLSSVDNEAVKKLLDYLNDNPLYFSSLNDDLNAEMNNDEVISWLKQLINYYDETLALIDQLFEQDDFLPPLRLQTFPGNLLKNSFFEAKRNINHPPEMEKNHFTL